MPRARARGYESPRRWPWLLALTLVCIGASVVAFILVPPVKKLMGGVR